MELKYISFNTKRSFGIELEINRKVSQAKLAEIVAISDVKRPVNVTGWSDTVNNSYWHIKTDSTCGDTGNKSDGGGFEICTFVAKGYKDLESIVKVIKALHDKGVQVNDHCGVHIHAQISDYNTTRVANLAACWAKMEPIFMQAVPEHRRDNLYCRNLSSICSSKTLNASKFWDKVRPRDLGLSDKRTSLNFTNFVRSINYGGGKTTVELRLPEGTLNYIDIKNWTRLYVNFISKAYNMADVTNIEPATVSETLEFLGLQNESPFFILSSGLFETKLWFLNRILRFSNNKKIREQVGDILSNIIEPGISHSSIEKVLGKEVCDYYTLEREEDKNID